MENARQKEFLAAYADCHEPFLRYCSALSYGRLDTEDLVQDVLLSAFTHYEQIKEKTKLLHYLIRAAKNRVISSGRRQRFKGEFIEKQAERLTAQETAADVVLDIQFMYKMLDHLPESQKEALVLFEISGFSMREIAEIQESTEGAVRTKISRGRQKLKSLFEENNGGPSPSKKSLIL